MEPLVQENGAQRMSTLLIAMVAFAAGSIFSFLLIAAVLGSGIKSDPYWPNKADGDGRYKTIRGYLLFSGDGDERH